MARPRKIPAPPGTASTAPIQDGKPTAIAPPPETMEAAIRRLTNNPEWNVREMLDHIHRWLAYQEEDLSYGLRSISDALLLYIAHQQGEDMTFPDRWPASKLVAVLGYDPLGREGEDEDGDE